MSSGLPINARKYALMHTCAHAQTPPAHLEYLGGGSYRNNFHFDYYMSGQSVTCSPGSILPPRTHLATLRDICVCHSWGWWCVCGGAGVSGTWMLWAKGKAQLLQHVRTPEQPSDPSSAVPKLRKPRLRMQSKWNECQRYWRQNVNQSPGTGLQKELTVWTQGREWRPVSKGWQWKLQSGSHMFDWFKYDWELWFGWHQLFSPLRYWVDKWLSFDDPLLLSWADHVNIH